MEPLKILVQLTSLHRVFDRSGRLPFAVVFGLCRRSLRDADERPLVLDVAGSALDVPYALANGLLTLHERDPHDNRNWIDVDISRLKHAEKIESEHVRLPSPVHRVGNYRADMAVYQHVIRTDSDLASILKPGKRYTVKLASDDLGVKSWAWKRTSRDAALSSTSDNSSSDEAGLVTSKSRAGSASFEVVESLPWPPEIRMTMSRSASMHSAATADSEEAPHANSTIEVSVTNIGSTPVSVQTRRYQHFLRPEVWFTPDAVIHDYRTRILDAETSKGPNGSLRVIRKADSQVVKDASKPRNIRPSTTGPPDDRPRLEDLVVLQPGVPITRHMNIEPLMQGLGDGEYTIELDPRGCWWTAGEVTEAEADKGRIPQRLYKKKIPPLVLQTDDKVTVRIRHGEIVLES